MRGFSPSAELREVLEGRVRLEDADPSVQSWARLPIHQAAVDIMQIRGRKARRAALERIPETIRPHVRARVEELWQRRG